MTLRLPQPVRLVLCRSRNNRTRPTTTQAPASTWDTRREVPGMMRLSVRRPSMKKRQAPYHTMYNRKVWPS